MKRVRGLCISMAVLMAILLSLWALPAKPVNAAGSVAINSTNFPDSKFRSYVKSTFDANKDNSLSAAEIEDATYVDVSEQGISSLKGIEYLTNLVTLLCYNNSLSELDLSSNTVLAELYCSENQLSALNLSSNKELIYLMCDLNMLTTLNLNSNTKLVTLYCDNNSLNSLSVNSCKALETLCCSGNNLKTLNVSNLSKLNYLYCERNQLTTLTLGSKPNLFWLVCHDNNLSTLDISNCPKITQAISGGIRNEYSGVISYDYAVGSDEYYFQFDDTVSLAAVPQIITHPSDVTAYAGTEATFTISATGQGISYQWECSTDGGATWTQVSGATETSVTVSAAIRTAWYQYRCVVTNSYGSTTSRAACLIVTSSIFPYIYAQPEDQTVAVGKTATFGVTASNVTQFQWYYSRDNGATWYIFSGKDGAILTVKGSATNNGCLYTCVIKNEKGNMQSYTVKLTVTGTKPGIYSQPGDRTREPNAEVSFYVGAMGAAKYQWQVSKDGGSTWKNISTATYPSAATATLKFNVSSKMNGYMYRCRITNSVGTVTSNVVKLTVGKPAITSQPSDLSTETGATATFKVSTSGAKSYKWQVSKDNGATWSNVNSTKYPSALTATLTFEASSGLNGYQYRCKVTNSEGTTTSNAALLTITNVKPKITSQPSNKTVTTGSTAKFTVNAVGSGMTYKWQVSKDGGKTWTDINQTKYPSAKTATLSFKATATLNGYRYRCIITNSYGSVTSGAAKLTVN